LINRGFKRFGAPGVFPADFTMRNQTQGFDLILSAGVGWLSENGQTAC
jgi:hypothetical protein